MHILRQRVRGLLSPAPRARPPIGWGSPIVPQDSSIFLLNVLERSQHKELGGRAGVRFFQTHPSRQFPQPTGSQKALLLNTASTRICSYLIVQTPEKAGAEPKPALLDKAIRSWFSHLNLQRQSPPSWYHDRLVEELAEVDAATTFWSRLSERSDIIFSITRARHDGFPIVTYPDRPRAVSARHVAEYAYMFAKFTSRWAFYRAAARLAGKEDWWEVREVINPERDKKIDTVAKRFGMDVERFGHVARGLRRWWPLLP